MTYIDYIIIGIAVIYAFIGFIKGFKKYFFGKLIKIAAAIAGVYFATMVATFLGQQQFVMDLLVSVPETFHNIILLVVSFLVIFILILIFFKIVGSIFKGKDKEGKGIIDRLLGLIFGVARAFVLVSIVFIGISLLSNLNQGIADYFSELLQLNNDETFSITKWCYNTAMQIYQYFQNFFAGEATELVSLLSK